MSNEVFPNSFKLSVVIPIYNEEKTLREIVGKVQASPYEKEILLIDDCSKDSSREVMKALEEECNNIRCFYHEKNLGKGGGLATGFAILRAEVTLLVFAGLARGTVAIAVISTTVAAATITATFAAAMLPAAIRPRLAGVIRSRLGVIGMFFVHID